MKLTPRQRTFLEKLRDLYRERRGPVHYSAVAERLGVSKFSAYDMLRVLEKKGVAGSEYLLSTERSGPGRSQVVFFPMVFKPSENRSSAISTGMKYFAAMGTGRKIRASFAFG